MRCARCSCSITCSCVRSCCTCWWTILGSMCVRRRFASDLPCSRSRSRKCKRSRGPQVLEQVLVQVPLPVQLETLGADCCPDDENFWCFYPPLLLTSQCWRSQSFVISPPLQELNSLLKSLSRSSMLGCCDMIILYTRIGVESGRMWNHQ